MNFLLLQEFYLLRIDRTKEPENSSTQYKRLIQLKFLAKKADILIMRFFYCLFFYYLTACSVYGPQGPNGPYSNPWNIQNQGSQFPNPNYNPNNPNLDPNNPNYNPNNPNLDPNNPNYNPNNPHPDPNNPNYNPNNPHPDPNNPNYNPNNPGNTPFHIPQNPIGGPSISPFPKGPGLSRSNDLPYNLMPDTITALTCDNTIIVDGSPYVLSVGSYREPYGGLRLSEDFVKNNDIESGTISQKVQQILSASPLKRARAQLAVRHANEVNSIISFNNKPTVSYFPPFDNPDNLERLSRQGISFTTRSSSSRSVYNSGRFKARLLMLGADFIKRSDIFLENGVGLITLVYSIGNHNPIYSPDKRPYGRSYKVSFRDSYKADFLTDIYEEDLRTSRREGSWECPIRFMIHDHKTEKGSGFNVIREEYRDYLNQYKEPEETDALLRKEGFCYTGKSSLSSLEKRFFEEEFGNLKRYFEIGTTIVFEKEGSAEKAYITGQPCLVPRGQKCYPPSSQKSFYRIEFDSEKNCSERITTTQGGHPLEDRFYKICPAYLSVCFRTQN